MTEPNGLATTAIVVAAGASTRLGGDRPDAVRKPFLVIEGRTVLEHSCAALAAVEAVREIVVVAHAADLERVRQLASRSQALSKVRRVIAGGELRVDSVRAGVAASDPAHDLVAIHDAARALVEPAVVARAIAVAGRHGAALVAVPVADTIKTSVDGATASSTLDRSVLWAAQTPQVFARELFGRLLARALEEGFRPTDDAALFERYVGPVPLVEGSPTNLKLTRPDDVALFEAILRTRRAGVGR